MKPLSDASSRSMTIHPSSQPLTGPLTGRGCPLRRVMSPARFIGLSSSIRRIPGFTLIELLIVITIIGVLIAILLPGVSHCTFLARQTKELSASRQLMVAFTSYADTYKGCVIPGYPTRAEVNNEMVVNDDEGNRVLNEEAQRYPWRLAPFINYDFRGYYQDDKALAELKSREPEYAAMGVNYRYVISLFPSLGMNTTFIGGTDRLNQFDSNYDNATGNIVIRRLDQCVRTSQVMVFGSARAEAQPLLPNFGKPQGYFRIDPPYLFAGQPRRWEESYDSDAAFPGLNSGFVALRKTKRSVAAYFDCHAETVGYEKLSDMRMWCDKADSATWGITQR